VRDWRHSSFHRDVRAGLFRPIGAAMSKQPVSSVNVDRGGSQAKGYSCARLGLERRITPSAPIRLRATGFDVAFGAVFDHPLIIAELWGRTMRGLLTLAYCLISILTAGQVMLGSSLSVGISALAASALRFFGTATFFGSFLARREKKSSALDLGGIGAIALVLVIAAFGLMLWSGFSLSVVGLHLSGPYWVVVGMVTALLVTTKQHAL
jgi:hypothetical protein